MPDSTPNRTSTTGPQRSPARAGRSVAEAAPVLFVRYWKRMRPNKVYPVVVTCTGRGEAAPVTLRIVMAGAQVVPAELEFDPSDPHQKATFYVTPLAKGSLRGERLEVLRDGMKIQELRMPSTVCTQRSTGVWLFLAFFVPWLMLHYLVYSPIGFQAPRWSDGEERYVAKPADRYGDGETSIKPRAKQITFFVKDNMPDLTLILGDSQDAKETIGTVQSYPEQAYVHLVRTYRDSGQPLAFYLFVLFLFFAIVSFVLRREGRKTVRGRPLSAGID